MSPVLEPVTDINTFVNLGNKRLWQRLTKSFCYFSQTIEHLTRDNLKLNPSQVTEVLDLLKKESVLEEEERMKEKLAKDKERSKLQQPIDEMYLTEEEQPEKKVRQQNN